MRAARFAAQLGFEVDESVVAAMTAMAERIEIISAERVRDELVKLGLQRVNHGLRFRVRRYVDRVDKAEIRRPANSAPAVVSYGDGNGDIQR